MKIVKITEDFDGYPTGNDSRTKRHFQKGEEAELSIAYADLLIAKGHAHEVGKAETKDHLHKPAAHTEAAKSKGKA